MGQVQDITGKRFGRLTALKRDGSTRDGHAIWQWKCDCGNVIKRSAHAVKQKTKSCGCHILELKAAMGKKK